MRISKNFSLEELIYSQTAAAKGIDNTPNQEQIDNLVRLTKNVLQPLRDAINRPITISSGFRSKELNEAIGGAKYSQHLDGCAADIVVDGLVDAFRYIINHLYVDQCIFEQSGEKCWIHVSYKDSGNRGEVLTYTNDGGYVRL